MGLGFIMILILSKLNLTIKEPIFHSQMDKLIVTKGLKNKIKDHKMTFLFYYIVVSSLTRHSTGHISGVNL